MNTLWIGGPCHGARGEGPISRRGKHLVGGAQGSHQHLQFLLLGHDLLCRYESISDCAANRLVAAVKR